MKMNGLKQLNKFFQHIQKKLNKKIIICPHPLTQNNLNYKKKFSNYEIIENNTMELIYNSDLVIHVGSTAFLMLSFSKNQCY